MHPIDARVHAEVSKGVRVGLLKRGPCAACNESMAIGHHECYSMPCMVIWLCRTCHTFRHYRWRYDSMHSSQTPRIIGEFLYESMRNNPDGILTLDDTVDVKKVSKRKRRRIRL